MFIKGICIHLLVFHSPCHKGFLLGKAVCLVLRLRLFAAEHSDNQVSGRSFSDVGMTMTCFLQDGNTIDPCLRKHVISSYIFRLYCHWIDITWRLKSTLAVGFWHGSSIKKIHMARLPIMTDITLGMWWVQIGCLKDRMGSKMVFNGMAQHENPMEKTPSYTSYRWLQIYHQIDLWPKKNMVTIWGCLKMGDPPSHHSHHGFQNKNSHPWLRWFGRNPLT